MRRPNGFTYSVSLNQGTIHVSVTVTSTASVVRKWISTTLFLHRRFLHKSRLVVGLGVQWTPCATERHPPADTLQLCVGCRCLIFQLAHANAAPRNLRGFLLDHRVTFAGFWNHSDRRKLENSWLGLRMRTDPVDLRLCTETDGGCSLKGASVNTIVEECLGFEVEQRKEIGISDWDEEFLSHEQVEYATVDAHCAFLIARDSKVWNFRD
ncbi:hypothetical protein HN51_065467 [Arachis hypogaea]|uniref:uncharacterized protein n=1 Tax=Arachis hypogaea TaxID=3818 RepID=UPI000DED0AC1|nr:uncharacterized protein LOC112741629 [Arachis hypogaea]QHO06614.1 Werner syndrome ATP-dependent helicase [Arachis hypogaea]